MYFNCEKKRFGCLAQMIGKTPLLEIKYRYQGQEHKIYTKDESYNLSFAPLKASVFLVQHSLEVLIDLAYA